MALFSKLRNFIKPQSLDEDIRRREYILNILILASLFVFIILNIIRIINYIINPHNPGRPLTYTLTILVFFLFLWKLTRQGWIKTASSLLIAIYSLPMFYSFITWGADLPAVLLLAILIIALFGLLIGARLVLISTLLINIFLLALTYLQEEKIIIVKDYWRTSPRNLGDAIAYFVLSIIIAIVVWLFSRGIQRALERARQSEQALKLERDSLEIKVQERTSQIRVMEADKINQLYRLAEFGRLSSGIFHDLVNPLTAISLNLEQIQNNNLNQVSTAKTYLGQAIIATHKMEDLIISIKKQLQRKSSLSSFSLNQEISQVIQILAYKARRANVVVEFQSSEELIYYGDAIKFSQIATNLICNAIESFESLPKIDQKIKISLQTEQNNIILKVTDSGCGIEPINLLKIFEPFFSTKEESGRGLGLGLSSTKNLVEKDFGGAITVTSLPGQETTFTVIISKKYET